MYVQTDEEMQGEISGYGFVSVLVSYRFEPRQDPGPRGVHADSRVTGQSDGGRRA